MLMELPKFNGEEDSKFVALPRLGPYEFSDGSVYIGQWFYGLK